ncbi:20527_t:CDS:2 [Funneliformis geosporum]|uniref:16591_t:CDS:1 n=1 Tax=Funneliformis geosporum TaxID=1117311 RepID=A0A9W4WNK2_9GLOM|nr:20527_t:CDS:2 [Funneliformis geosporum]CAI2174880.1 16591_t:CDS:2 [Funneliformis geosporum]
MNTYSVNQVQSVEYYSMGADNIAPANSNPAQLSLVEPNAEQSQHVVIKQEDITQVSPPDSSKEHSPTPSISKTTYTCHECGKRYKHRNCLVKHLWEHHESWELCLKFNLTKHQQVQMMEAAQILVDLACIKQH